MSERLRDILTVAVIVAVLLSIVVGLRLMRRAPMGVTPSPSESGQAVPSGARPGGRQGVSAGAVQPATPRDGGAGAARAVPGAGSGAGSASGTEGGAVAASGWVKRPPVEFTAADLIECGRGVQLDLGSYAVAAGDEFEVSLRVAAPALESFTLVVRYDVQRLAAVAGSARPSGGLFRGGIECYTQASGGRLVLIHAGAPGRKNLDAGSGETAVIWRMRALQPGVVQLSADPETSFTNGRGDEERYELAGGQVTIR